MILQVTSTLPSREEAERLARTVVEERLAACAQVAGPITSTYRWRGKVETASEWYCHLKTTPELYPELERRVRALHPYEVPEILAVAAERVSPAYADWVRDETGKSVER